MCQFNQLCPYPLCRRGGWPGKGTDASLTANYIRMIASGNPTIRLLLQKSLFLKFFQLPVNDYSWKWLM